MFALIKKLAEKNPKACVFSDLLNAFVGVSTNNLNPVAVYDKERAIRIVEHAKGLCRREAELLLQNEIDALPFEHAPIFVHFGPDFDPAPSKDVLQIIGKYIPNEPDTPVCKFLKECLCKAPFVKEVAEFASAQPERCDPRNLTVDSVDSRYIFGRFPAMVTDHESLTPFRVDVLYRFDVEMERMERIEA